MAPRSALRRSCCAASPRARRATRWFACSVLKVGEGGTKARAAFRLPTEKDWRGRGRGQGASKQGSPCSSRALQLSRRRFPCAHGPAAAAHPHWQPRRVRTDRASAQRLSARRAHGAAGCLTHPGTSAAGLGHRGGQVVAPGVNGGAVRQLLCCVHILYHCAGQPAARQSKVRHGRLCAVQRSREGRSGRHGGSGGAAD